MSQVVVENDNLRDRRQASREQERQIAKNAYLTKWQRNDVTKTKPIEKLIGLAVLPILALWSLIAGLGGFVLWVLTSLFNFLGKLFSRRND